MAPLASPAAVSGHHARPRAVGEDSFSSHPVCGSVLTSSPRVCMAHRTRPPSGTAAVHGWQSLKRQERLRVLHSVVGISFDLRGGVPFRINVEEGEKVRMQADVLCSWKDDRWCLSSVKCGPRLAHEDKGDFGLGLVEKLKPVSKCLLY